MILNPIKFFHKYPILVLVFLASCNNIDGVYVANHGNGFDTLKILSNHKYVRIFYNSDKSKMYSDTGKWETSKGRINFQDWMDRSGTQHFEGKGPIVFGTDINKSWFSNEIIIQINYDLEYYYIKRTK